MSSRFVFVGFCLLGRQKSQGVVHTHGGRLILRDRCYHVYAQFLVTICLSLRVVYFHGGLLILRDRCYHVCT